MRKILIGLVALVVLGAIIGGHHGSTSTSSSSAEAATSPAAKPQIKMLRGPVSDNNCIENDSEARIYVTITLRNSGDASGTVNPWVAFNYSDGGNSTESYNTNWGHEITVPAHTEVDATFYHTFNPQQHSLIRCAGSRDLNDSSAPSWYMPVTG
jgi:hypothetical protein